MNRAKIMRLAWRIRKDSINANILKGADVITFSNCLVIAWDATKKRTGKAVETVTANFTNTTPIFTRTNFEVGADGWYKNPQSILGYNETPTSIQITFRS